MDIKYTGAIEVRALVNDNHGNPIFAWITLPLDSIADVSEARTSNGQGASLRLRTGQMLIVSNLYKEIRDAMGAERGGLSYDPSVEEEVLTSEIERMADAPAAPGIPSTLGLVEGGEFGDDGEEDFGEGAEFQGMVDGIPVDENGAPL